MWPHPCVIQVIEYSSYNDSRSSDHVIIAYMVYVVSLCGHHTLQQQVLTCVTSPGIAVEEDVYHDARQEIEQELAHREAVEAATRILQEILDGVRTPERPSSPVDAYITVSDI